MIVNEGGLLKAMKASYKDGYHVAAGLIGDREYMMIISYGYSWAVAIQRDNVPRKVLGLIAEHIGKLPQNRDAYQVKRDEDPQEEMFRVATEPLFRLIEAAQEADTISKMLKTKLVYGGRNVWQRLDDMEVMLIPPRNENIAMWKKMEAKRVENYICLKGQLSQVFISRAAPGKEEQTMLDRMGKTLWL